MMILQWNCVNGWLLMIPNSRHYAADRIPCNVRDIPIYDDDKTIKRQNARRSYESERK